MTGNGGVRGDFYEVGYRKPPRSTQFRRGVSGNPTGRPKGSKSVGAILNAIARKKITVTSNGRTQKVTMLEAIMMQLTNRAAGGDLKAIREVLGAFRLFVNSDVVLESGVDLNEHDAAVMKNLAKRLNALNESEAGKKEIGND
jgi:hypothetical protein